MEYITGTITFTGPKHPQKITGFYILNSRIPMVHFMAIEGLRALNTGMGGEFTYGIPHRHTTILLLTPSLTPILMG